MDNLIISGTNVAPRIVFLNSGKLKLEGKIITENAVLTFEPINRWLESFNGKVVEFEINLEYMNTSASMQLYSLLNKLDENEAIPDVKVNWYYDEDDEEHLETGEMFEDRLDNIKFRYIKLAQDEEKGAA